MAVVAVAVLVGEPGQQKDGGGRWRQRVEARGTTFCKGKLQSARFGSGSCLRLRLEWACPCSHLPGPETGCIDLREGSRRHGRDRAVTRHCYNRI